MKISFSDYLDQLRSDLKGLAAKEWSDYKDAAVKDGLSFVKNSKDDLERWTAALALKQLTTEEFEFLVKGKLDVAALQALKKEGLTKARLEKFRDSAVSVVIGSLVKTVLA